MKKMLWALMGTVLMLVSYANVSIMSGPCSYQPPVPPELNRD